jgi:hypothetical protein
MQTEVDSRHPLFPKEQVPASTPIPPREVGTNLLGMMAFCRCSPSGARSELSRAATGGKAMARPSSAGRMEMMAAACVEASANGLWMWIIG